MKWAKIESLHLHAILKNKMSLVADIKERITGSIKELYRVDLTPDLLTINQTKPEFEGDYTLVMFSFIKQLKKSPEQLGTEIGSHLVQNHPELFSAYNVIKGFLNLVIRDEYWVNYLGQNFSDKSPGRATPTGVKVMVEYSSPNTNKPLHLGHLRNNFLGWSVAKILEERGHEVIKSCIVNDRGIHICKSMIAWKKFANGETPETTGMKGDHFVGEYYVRFNDAYKLEIDELVARGMEKAEAEKQAPIMQEAQQMLKDWEDGKPEVMELWKKMNNWVYQGFDVTYKRIGSDFQKMYYESETYLPGKRFVEEGLQQGVFYKKEDGSAWIDLTSEGLDEKLV